MKKSEIMQYMESMESYSYSLFLENLKDYVKKFFEFKPYMDFAELEMNGKRIIVRKYKKNKDHYFIAKFIWKKKEKKVII